MEESNLFNFSTKPKILFYADSPITHRIGEQHKKYLPEYEIDIASSDWQDVLYSRDYDVLCHTNLTLLIWKTRNFEDFVKEQQSRGTKVVLADRNQIYTAMDFYKVFDGVFVNDSSMYEVLKSQGLSTAFIPDGVDLSTFGPDVPFQKRSFKVATRKSDRTWQRLREKCPEIEFVELFDKTINAALLNEAYNACQVFYGSFGFMEAAACGLIPVMKRKSGLENFQNIFSFDDDDSLIEKILSLKDSQDTILFSQRVSKEMLAWDYCFLSHLWAESVQQILLKKKAVSFI